MLDSASREIVYLRVELVGGTDSPIFSLWVNCTEGSFLTAQSGLGSRVLARLHGSGNAFQDINTNPLLLATSGLIQFDFKLHPVLTTGRLREQIGIAVVQSGAALWEYVYVPPPPPPMSNEIIGGPGNVSSVIIDPSTGYINFTDETGNLVGSFRNGQLYCFGPVGLLESVTQVLGVDTAGILGIPAIRTVLKVNNTGANVATTTLYTPANGESIFRTGLYLNMPNGGTSGTFTIQIFYTDKYGAPQTTQNGIAYGNLGGEQTYGGLDVFQTDGVSPIQWNWQYEDVVGTIEASLVITVEALG
jgi:hypothetical protein